MMRQVRNFVMRLSINYIALSILLVLAGWGVKERQLFGTWIAALVFTLLTVTLRRFLLAFSLSLIIMTAGLFIFVIDGIILVLTAALTSLRVTNAWWVLAGVLVMSIANIWVEKIYWRLGWLRRNYGSAAIEEHVLTAQPTSWIRRLLLLAILLGGIVFSLAMAAQVFLAAGQLLNEMSALTATASVAFALFVFAIAWLVAEGLALHRRALFAVIVTLLASALVVTTAVILLFSPGPVLSEPNPQPRPETAYWQLPTGSHIAYSYFPAQENTTRNPVIFLHGGLGRAVLDSDITFFSELTREGFDVYFYDLVGTGLSGRLADISEYTINQHILDLEQIRTMIKADRLIVIAHAEGSEIAIRYMIQHPDRVEGVVFYSPTSLWEDQNYYENTSRTAVEVLPSYTRVGVHQTVALALGLYNPKLAQTYVSQEDMTVWTDMSTDEGLMVCAGNRELAPSPVSPGYNAYVGLIGDVTDDAKPDPRVRLREVFVPTILLRGECDYVDWGVVQQYWEVVPNIQVYYLVNAGSMLHLQQPGLVKGLLLGFLNDTQMPLEPLSDAAIRAALPLLDEVR
jgi:pimeloyl-ACP methyl ester carboxylesterase/uncharacterized membrane protein YvlD (DUF360 family)